MDEYTAKDHTFVILAYKESEFLAECIDSLLAQTVSSNIIISTATPNEYIKRISENYDIELRINDKPPSISGDWNFAYNQAKTRLITLGHQDDVYLPNYLTTAIAMLNKCKKPIIFFSHYAEIIEGEVVFRTLRLNVRKIMLMPLRMFNRSKFIRRRLLSLGNVVCCPSVMYADIDSINFSNDFKCNLDWDKWEKLSKEKGSFVCCKEPLIYHRLHDKSETALSIQDSTRMNEDYIMFKRFWCAPIAKLLLKLYSKSEVGQ